MKTKLMLHVGLPKTGTSALQYWLDANRALLKEQGINYPLTDGATTEPKHQFLIHSLLNDDVHPIQDHLSQNNETVLILSAEGLTNHLYDFAPNSLAHFRSLTSSYETIIVLVVRDTQTWTKSYWKQAVVNPPNPEFHYATPLSLEQFRNLPRTQRLCDQPKLITKLRAAYGAQDVRVVNYDENYLVEVCNAMSISLREEMGGLSPGNVSLSDDVIELIRQINERNHPTDVRNVLMAAIHHSTKSKHIGLEHFYKYENAIPQTLQAARMAVDQLVPHCEPQRRITEHVKTLLTKELPC